jgi:hypothetical protein
VPAEIAGIGDDDVRAAVAGDEIRRRRLQRRRIGDIQRIAGVAAGKFGGKRDKSVAGAAPPGPGWRPCGVMAGQRLADAAGCAGQEDAPIFGCTARQGLIAAGNLYPSA